MGEPTGYPGGHRSGVAQQTEASSSTSSRALDLEGNGAHAQDHRLHPEVAPSRQLLPDLLGRAHEPALPPIVRGPFRRARRAGRSPASARSGGADRPRPRRRARRGRATATRSPGRARRRRTPAPAPRAAPGRRRASTPSRCSSRRRGRPRPAAPGRPCPPRTAAAGAPGARAGRPPRARARWYAPANVCGSPPMRPPTTSSASRRRSTRAPGGGIGHADRLVVGLVPARAETDVETAARDPVERGERLGEHRRGAQRLEQHQRAEAHAGDGARPARRAWTPARTRRSGWRARRTWRGRGTGGR